MTDVVDRAHSVEQDEPFRDRRREERRVLIIMSVLMLLSVFANFWF